MIRELTALALLGALALPARAEDPDDAKAKIQNQLETTKISLEFTDAGLNEVVDFLHEVTQINIVLSKEVQQRVREGELKITLRLEDLQLRAALKLMLSLHDLTAVVRSGVLLIMTKEERGGEVEMKMIDVRDLLMRIEDFAAPEINLRDPNDGDMRGVGITPPDDKPFEHPDSLLEIVRNATGGDTVWGRDGVSIAISNGMLIVAHNPEVLKQVEELVLSLRQYK